MQILRAQCKSESQSVLHSLFPQALQVALMHGQIWEPQSSNVIVADNWSDNFLIYQLNSKILQMGKMPPFTVTSN